MKIYIAASYPRRKEALALANQLDGVVSRWVFLEDTGPMEHRAVRDMEDIKRADVMIQFTGDGLSHGGRHAELGLMLPKPVFLIGPREQVMHYHPSVRTTDDIFRSLQDIKL